MWERALKSLRHRVDNMADQLIPKSAPYAFDSVEEPLPENRGAGIEQLFESRTAILKTKLEVFASEIFDRLHIRQKNLLAIDCNREQLGTLIADVTRQADYLLRDRRDVLSLQQIDFDLEKERREQETSCWRDVADVMKDFLEVWEALAQARARSVFLSGYG